MPEIGVKFANYSSSYFLKEVSPLETKCFNGEKYNFYKYQN